jgi:hypothetical protein
VLGCALWLSTLSFAVLGPCAILRLGWWLQVNADEKEPHKHDLFLDNGRPSCCSLPVGLSPKTSRPSSFVTRPSSAPREDKTSSLSSLSPLLPRPPIPVPCRVFLCARLIFSCSLQDVERAPAVARPHTPSSLDSRAGLQSMIWVGGKFHLPLSNPEFLPP